MLHARNDYNRIQDPENKIPVDEPVFLIRGQDVCGADAVRAWIELAQKNGADPDIINHARNHIPLMEAWSKKKIPDLPTPDKTLSGDEDQSVILIT